MKRRGNGPRVFAIRLTIIRFKLSLPDIRRARSSLQEKRSTMIGAKRREREEKKEVRGHGSSNLIEIFTYICTLINQTISSRHPEHPELLARTEKKDK